MKIKLKYAPGVYRDAEDSWLLQKYVAKYATDAQVLDIGTGTGIQAITAALAGAKSVIATDISRTALKLAKLNAELNKVKISFIACDLLSSIKGKFDLIIFNPPYLPAEQPIDPMWAGGRELILKFIKQAKTHLKEHGKILFVFSSLTKLNLEVKILEKAKFPFEMLYVAELSRDD